MCKVKWSDDEIQLYKLIMNPDDRHPDVSYVTEFRWVNDKQFCIWIDYVWVEDFIKGMIEIFGHDIFDAGEIYANLQHNCLCIDLCEVFEGSDINIEELFPKDKYSH